MRSAIVQSVEAVREKLAVCRASDRKGPQCCLHRVGAGRAVTAR